MDFLIMGILLYLAIGAIIGSIVVLSKSGQNLITEASYKMPITHSKIVWFATITFFFG